MSDLNEQAKQFEHLLKKHYKLAVNYLTTNLRHISPRVLSVALDQGRFAADGSFEAIISVPGVAEKFGADREGQSSLIFLAGRTLTFGAPEDMDILMKHAEAQIREAAKLSNEDLGVHPSQSNGAVTRAFLVGYDAGNRRREAEASLQSRPPLDLHEQVTRTPDNDGLHLTT